MTMAASHIAAKVTILTPIAPYHQERIAEVQASVQAQTIPCLHLIHEDTDKRGAGAARNALLSRVTTPYIIFLDADDTIDATFAERTLAAYDPGHYIYTDWWQGMQHKQPPDGADVWRNGTYHCITTLIATDDARRIGGFDEIMPGAEDTDFYIRLRLSGVCPKRLPEPLFTYGAGGQRSKLLVESGQLSVAQMYMRERYGALHMGCCGGNSKTVEMAAQGQFEGAVLARAMWAGNRRIRGKVTGINYPRTGNRKKVWVHPDDIAAMDGLFKPVEDDSADNSVVLQPRTQDDRARPSHAPATSLADVGNFFAGAKAAPKPVPFNEIPAPELNKNDIVSKGQDAIG